jgi:glutathione S-transferase
MITLATFGPAFGLPDPSPFVTKADVLLQMSGLPYEKQSARGLGKAPKGKLPYIVDDGQTVADSTFIRLHLEKKYGIDFDRGLTPAQRGAAWAVDKMLEDHLYWITIRWRWLDDANFAKGPAMFFAGVPAPIRPVIKGVVRRSLRKTLHLHGIGRHSDDELNELTARLLQSVSGMLEGNEYLTGQTTCGADATTYAFMLSALCPHFDNPMRSKAESLPNIVAYCERMTKKFYA